MRKVQEVVLEGLPVIKMQEMTPVHFPVAIGLLKEVLAAGNLTHARIVELVMEHYDKCLQVLVDCSGMSDDEFRGLGASDFVAVVEGWVQANESFFDRIKEKIPAPGIPGMTPPSSKTSAG